MHTCILLCALGDFENLFVGKAKQFKFSHKFPPGSQSLFRVRARNAIGWSEYSDEMVHNVGQAAPSVPPSPSLSSSTPHSLTLHWNVPPGQTLVTLFCLEMDDPNKVSRFSILNIYFPMNACMLDMDSSTVEARDMRQS